VGYKAIEVYDKPDSGTMRSAKPDIHTHSSIMCWVAVDRLARIAASLQLTERFKFWKSHAGTIYEVILKRAWNPELKTFVSIWDGTSVDPFLLLLPGINFITATDPRFVSTLQMVGSKLLKNKYIVWNPHDSHAHCAATFWYIHSLADVGMVKEARQLFENMLHTRNHLGILSETVDHQTRELWGNFPHVTSMVGLISCAIRLSRNWKEAY